MRKQSWSQVVWANSISKGPSRLVLCAMAAGCNPDGIICLSVPELMRFTKLCERSVQRSLDDLVKLKELFVFDAEKKRGRGQIRKFRIRVQSRIPYHGTERATDSIPLLPLKGVPQSPFEEIRLYNVARACGELQEDAPTAPAANPFDEPSPHLQEEPVIYAKVAFE